jgi:PST family polysaccharide transporter
MRKSGQNLMVGAGILTLAGMIAKLLSAVYRIPFQNLVGNTGFYVYQQVYPIYGIGVVLALSGWPVFISKIITEQPDEAHQQLVARRLFWWLLFISCGLFILVYGGAPILALGMGGNLKLTPVVKAVAWMFWFMPFLAVGRGPQQFHKLLNKLHAWQLLLRLRGMVFRLNGLSTQLVPGRWLPLLLLLLLQRCI